MSEEGANRSKGTREFPKTEQTARKRLEKIPKEAREFERREYAGRKELENFRTRSKPTARKEVESFRARSKLLERDQ